MAIRSSIKILGFILDSYMDLTIRVRVARDSDRSVLCILLCLPD